MEEYVKQADRIYYRHKISHNLPCNAYSMHTHNSYELIYFVSGEATHIIEDRMYKLHPGDLVIIRPMRYHFIQIDAPSDYERYNILFDVERHGIGSALRLPEEVEVVNLRTNTLAEDIFRRCELYRRQCDDTDFEQILQHLLNELFFSLELFPQPPSEAGSTLSPLISQALRYVNENLVTLQSVEEIAEHLFVSESYLFRRFRAELRQTPKRYVREKRLLLAQRCISEGKNPTAVAEACGFRDYTTFYRNYLSFFGHAPSEE